LTGGPSCPSCGEPLGTSGGTCPACGATAPVNKLKLTATLSPARLPGEEPPGPPAEAPPPSADESVARRAGYRSQTRNTLFNLADAARSAVEATARAPQTPAPAEAPPGPVPGAPVVAPAAGPAVAESAVAAEAPQTWSRLSRVTMLAGGAALLVLFLLDVSLLGALGGMPLVLAIYYLIGGLLLLASPLLPMPDRLRAALATVVGAVPLFVTGPFVGDMGGWRGLAAALVLLVLPGALLLRSRVTASRLARWLVTAAVVLCGLIYLVPDDGVVPLSLAFGLIGSGALTGMITGVCFLLPLGLAVCTLTVFAGPGSTGLGTLWACLVLLNAAGAVIIGGELRDDQSLVHLGVGLLAAGAAAAVGVADLLDARP